MGSALAGAGRLRQWTSRRRSGSTRPLLAVPGLVLAVGLLGAALTAGVVLAFGADRAGSVPVPGRPTGWLVLALATVVCGCEMINVRLRHGDVIEELALSEAAVIVTVLVLPPAAALFAAIAGFALASALQRRPWVKAAFNVGNYAASSAVLIVIVRLLAPPDSGFTLRTAVGLALGTLAFATINLLNLSRVLGTATGVDPWQIVREQARLSVFMAYGTAALGAMTLDVALSAPALLPFTAMPAVALVYAYRTAAQESDERERTRHLIKLSEVLAGRLDGPQIVTGFLATVRAAFGADVAQVMLLPGTVLPDEDGAVTVEADHAGIRWGQPDAGDLARLRKVTRDERPSVLGPGKLPGATSCGLLAALETEGVALGTLTLAATTRKALGARDLSVFAPLASALGVALRGAQYQSRMHEQTSNLATVLDQSSDGILVLDGKGEVALWSPALAALAGRSATEAVGHPLAELINAVDPDGKPVDAYLLARDQLAADSPHVTVEMGIIRPDGEQRWVRAAHGAVFDSGTLLRDVVIVHDITKQRGVERLKSDFIATVSHELRTPVTPIKGYADLLRRRGDSMSAATRAECIRIISDRADHLANLVEDLLLASKITGSAGPRHDIRLQTGDLTALIRRAMENFPDDAPRLALDLPDRPVPVACDPLRVVQIVTNLVSNALKYSGADRPVDVGVSVGPAGAAITVADQGRGIPADQIDRIFEKFHRVEDPMLMTTSGTGLGLFIARQLAVGMGGTLTASSTLGVGSVLCFTLPARRPLRPLASSVSDPPPDAAVDPAAEIRGQAAPDR